MERLGYVCSLLIPLQGWNGCFFLLRHQNFHFGNKADFLEGKCQHAFKKKQNKKNMNVFFLYLSTFARLQEPHLNAQLPIHHWPAAI